MPDFNIANFRGSLNREGVLLDNRFLMVITPPKGLKNKTKMKDITIRCDSTNLPGKALITEDQVYRYGYGVPERIPYNSLFHDVTATFILDRNASQLKFFSDWYELIHNTDTTQKLTNSSVFELEYKSNYASTITIYMYNDKSKNVIECKLFEAYPQMIQDKQLSWHQGEVLKTGIVFYYRNYKITVKENLLDNLIETFGLDNLFGKNVVDIQSTLSKLF